MHSEFNRFINPLYRAINYGKLIGIFMLFFLTMFMMFNEFVASIYRSAESHVNGTVDIHAAKNILRFGLEQELGSGSELSHAVKCSGQLPQDTFLKEFSYATGDISPLAE
jgi:hypothetical protein